MKLSRMICVVGFMLFLSTGYSKYVSAQVQVIDGPIARNHLDRTVLKMLYQERFDELESTMRETISQRTRDEWLELLHAADAPCGPVLTLGELKADPHIQRRALIVEEENGMGARVEQVAYPVRFSETPTIIERLAPALGEHTEEILMDLGYSSNEIKELRKERAV